MQPMTPSPWRRGHNWPQFNVEKNGFEMLSENILQERTNKNINHKKKFSVGIRTLSINLFFYWKHLILFATCFSVWKLNFKRPTGKSYSNIKYTQGSYVNQCIIDERH